MGNIKNRILVALLAFAIAVSSMGSFSPAVAETALTEDKMKEVLIIVKGKLDVGDEYTQFDYDYNEYSGNGRYQFNWRTEDNQAYISASADSTGRIYSVSTYDYNKNTEYEGQLPKYIGEELIPKAQEWVEKIEPELKGKLNLKACRYQSYRRNYYISFVRCENGIDLNDNSVSVSIDAMDGSILSYNLNWNFEVSIPKVDEPIGEKAAAEKVGQNVKMELQYRLATDSEGNPKVYLAYNPDKTYIAVDAKNGKVYTEKVYWGSSSEFEGGFNTENATAEDADSKEALGSTVRLSDAEIKKIDEIKDIISSEEAVKLIKNNKMLYIDQNLTNANCRLYSNDGEYYWRIYLSDDRPIDYSSTDIYYDYYRASLNASIDAKTGKLISFSASTKDYYSYSNEGDDVFQANYTKKQCQKLFEEFVKTTESEKYKDVKLSNVYDRNVYIYNVISGKDDSAVGGYSYSYSRYYKDIPFYANTISGEVEAVTGKVTRYYLNWTDAEIPEPENLIGEQKAFDSYIACDGFDLIYELVSKYENKNNYYGYDKEVKARLVYRTAISPNFIDAFTGKQLNWNGEEYKPAGVSYKYTDINGTKYERSIKLLADMGYGLEGEEFKPSDKITNEDFEKILGAYGRNYYKTADGEDDGDEVINDNELTVTRQEAAMIMITRMGAEKLAKMDIYKTGFSDEKKIAQENVGAVALCKGLGIMGAKSGNKFKPNSAITRGEAADLIIRMLSVAF